MVKSKERKSGICAIQQLYAKALGEIIPKFIFRKVHNAVIALVKVYRECDVSLLLIFAETE